MADQRQLEHRFPQPLFNSGLHEVKLAQKKMVSAFNKDQLLRIGGLVNDFLKLFRWRILVL